MEQEFSKILRDWYRKNGRKLPWRSTKDPFKIWLSEIILQQTRVNQGLPYYWNFINSFPQLQDLANAPLDRILKHWQGLGYYSRARNMHLAARDVLVEHHGIFPASYEALRKLKGIGDYTAAAIASFAFDLPYPVVDGNVYRFLSRLTGEAIPIDSPKGKKHFTALAAELLDPAHAAEHNQAIMEIGATLCKPQSPLCEECPFCFSCHAYINNATGTLPVKTKKQKTRKRFFHYFFMTNSTETCIIQRNAKDIWHGLFEFPMIETETEDIDIHNIRFPFGLEKLEKSIQGAPVRMRHLLTHQELIAYFWRINVSGPWPADPALKNIPLADIGKYAFPQLIIRYMQKAGLND